MICFCILCHRINHTQYIELTLLARHNKLYIIDSMPFFFLSIPFALAISWCVYFHFFFFLFHFITDYSVHLFCFFMSRVSSVTFRRHIVVYFPVCIIESLWMIRFDFGVITFGKKATHKCNTWNHWIFFFYLVCFHSENHHRIHFYWIVSGLYAYAMRYSIEWIIRYPFFLTFNIDSKEKSPEVILNNKSYDLL